MKRICAFFFLALTLLMCLTAAAEEANLIANGGFETLDASGNPEGWYPTAYRTQEGYSRIAITSEKARSGQYSAVWKTPAPTMRAIPAPFRWSRPRSIA